MYQDLRTVLGDRWTMYYHPAWPMNKLTVVFTLDQCLAKSNQNLQTLGRKPSTWPAGDQNQIARLVRMNWIYNRLDIEPIRKPIVAHRQGDNMIVDCGDTRLMALGLLDRPVMVSVVLTDRVDSRHSYPGWIRVHDQVHLLALAGFNADAHVVFTPGGDDQALTWLEMGDQSTAHHLHDQGERVNMMQNFLNSQANDFLFDRAWAASMIDWDQYRV